MGSMIWRVVSQAGQHRMLHASVRAAEGPFSAVCACAPSLSTNPPPPRRCSQRSSWGAICEIRHHRCRCCHRALPPAAGAVPVLVAALQPPRMDSTAMETIFEAAWAITNLAVVGCPLRECRCRGCRCLCCCLSSRLLPPLLGEPCGCPQLLTFARTHALSHVPSRQGEFETVKAVLAAAPILIAYLGGGSGLPVAEQCAWALGAAPCIGLVLPHAPSRTLCLLLLTLAAAGAGLSTHAGNIAAEDFEFRQTLIANGVVRPLAQLLVGARRALDSGTGVPLAGRWRGVG